MIPVVLASTSASRRAILDHAGVEYEAVAPGVDEDPAKARLQALGAKPRAIASSLAEQKAQAVSGRRGGLVIGADQTLECDGELFDKAPGLAAARANLLELRGRLHRLHAAVALARDGKILWRTCETARLTMRQFSDAWLDGYLQREGDRVLGSVGGYRLEGEGAQLFERIDGDYFAILGLPLLPLLGELRRHGGLAT